MSGFPPGWWLVPVPTKIDQATSCFPGHLAENIEGSYFNTGWLLALDWVLLWSHLISFKSKNPQYIKNHVFSNLSKRIHSPIKNGGKISTDTSTKKIYRGQITTWKDVQHHISLGKCKLKPPYDPTSHPLGWLKCEDWPYQLAVRMRKNWNSHHYWWGCRMLQSLWKMNLWLLNRHLP